MADQRHGIAVATLANVNRDGKKRPEPYRPNDFIYWHESHRQTVKYGGMLKADPEAQSILIKRSLFKAK